MLVVNEIEKSVIVSDSTGDIVVVDGQTFELVNGSIEIYNLPSVYDVIVYKITEENHIPRPEPEIVEEIIEVIPDETEI